MEQPGPASGTIFYVKHVVCPRGIRVLRELLTELGLTPRRVELGEAEVAEAAQFQQEEHQVVQKHQHP